jgi:hypothetical protein
MRERERERERERARLATIAPVSLLQKDAVDLPHGILPHRERDTRDRSIYRKLQRSVHVLFCTLLRGRWWWWCCCCRAAPNTNGEQDSPLKDVHVEWMEVQPDYDVWQPAIVFTVFLYRCTATSHWS